MKLNRSSSIVLVVLGLQLLSSVNSFCPTSAMITAKTVQPVFAASSQEEEETKKATPSSALELFASEGWGPIKKDMDSVPTFCVSNKEGKPIAYAITINDDTFQVPFFYCDVDDAKDELAKAKEANSELAAEMDLIPFPLGVAFEMWSKDQAVIVPSAEAIKQAGAPPGTNPIGQPVPLFACMDIMQETSDGKGALPLFLDMEEANGAVKEAVDSDGGSSDDFEVVSLSLNRAVELLATVPGTPGFQFIPPQSSIKHINEYLSES
eukprot:scaffold22613_cov126-Cylindrotheca_fusiformis.AAC.14